MKPFRHVALRLALLVFAFLHTLPARKHLVAFVGHPSLSEAWKGFGALVAVVIYLLAPQLHARALAALWSRHRAVLMLAGFLLAAAHAVPAADHLPRFFATPAWAEAWRGWGALFASLWFIAPMPFQARVLSAAQEGLSIDDSPRGARASYVLVTGLAVGVVFGAGVVRASVPHDSMPLSARDDGPSLTVPRATGDIVPDGELEDWTGAEAHTGAFTTDGVQTRPYSDARFLHRDGTLYVVLYAADEDIRATAARHDDPLYLADAFQVVFHTKDGDRLVDVSPRGVVTDGARAASGGKIDFAWESRARVGVDLDGIIDDTSDLDEEWVVEMALPLDAIGLRGDAGERVPVSIRRCDQVKGVGRSCGGWTGTLVLGR